MCLVALYRNLVYIAAAFAYPMHEEPYKNYQDFFAKIFSYYQKQNYSKGGPVTIKLKMWAVDVTIDDTWVIITYSCHKV